MGIRHLAAFLYYSTQMVVCYSESYLRKLWTVYEVAVFLTLHPGSTFCLRHELHWKTLFYGIGICSVTSMIWHVVHSRGINQSLQNAPLGSLTGVSVAASCVYYYIACFRLSISEHVNRFRVANAECFDESDRALVEQNIVLLMRHRGFVQEPASDSEVIAKFENLVRRELPLTLSASFGRSGIPYSTAVCASLPYFLQNVDSVAVQFLDGQAADVIFLMHVHRFTLNAAVFPLVAALSIVIANFFIQRSWGFKSTVTLMALVHLLFLGTMWISCYSLSAMARRGTDYAALALIAIVAILHALTFAAYRPIRSMRYRRVMMSGGGDSLELQEPAAAAGADEEPLTEGTPALCGPAAAVGDLAAPPTPSPQRRAEGSSPPAPRQAADQAAEGSADPAAPGGASLRQPADEAAAGRAAGPAAPAPSLASGGAGRTAAPGPAASTPGAAEGWPQGQGADGGGAGSPAHAAAEGEPRGQDTNAALGEAQAGEGGRGGQLDPHAEAALAAERSLRGPGIEAAPAADCSARGPEIKDALPQCGPLPYRAILPRRPRDCWWVFRDVLGDMLLT
ncbi:unnamed protein product [Prorocentrum cordatum]|uniref:Uncharacterized protein n=1 Tax=Prorocentrum cordatum TaxID=2364126 RepID=A0ABN9WCQ0_9DINO|nr:unnamed protein product [Polarella glacialis]